MLAVHNDRINIRYDNHVKGYFLRYVTWLVPIGETIRHVSAVTVMDGGMVEFYHVDDNNKLAGCMGIIAFKEAIQSGEIGIVDTPNKAGIVEYND